MNTFLQSIRSLWRQRAFSALVIAIVALGVGANAAVFAIVNGVLLRKLPFNNAEQLVVVTETAQTFDTGLASPNAFLEWRDRNPPFSKMAAFMWWEGTGEDPVLMVSAGKDFFDVLGAKPILGRTFSDEEIRGGPDSAVILSYEYWQKQYGGDPGVIGQRIGAAGSPVIGVMPPGAINLQIGWAHLWRPFRMRQELDRTQTTDARYVRVVGRLRPGVSREQALAQMNMVQRQLQNERPELFAGYDVRITPLRDMMTGEFRPALLILMGTVGCLLLLACASLANLLIARSGAQEREMAVRIALGASRFNLVSRALLDNLVLTTLGATAGLLVCQLMIGSLTRYDPGLSSMRIGVNSWPVVAMGAGLALGTAFLVTALVALTQRRMNVYECLKEGGRSATAGARRQKIRGLLVSAEIALALSLLIVSGLLSRSFISLLGADLGFKPDHVLIFESSIGGNVNNTVYNTGEKRVAYYRSLMQSLASLPEVASVGGMRYFPMHARLWTTTIQTRENPERKTVYWNRVAGDYFQAMDIPLIAGRLPTPQEMWEGGKGLLVNQSAARTLFPGGTAVGKQIGSGGNFQEVIGVVGDVRQAGLDRPPGAEIYALTGENRKTTKDSATSTLTIAVRTHGKPDSRAIQAITSAVRRYDNSTTGPAVTPLTEFLGNTVAARRIAARLGSVFAALSLLLSALGVYGLVTYWVTQRTAEIGVRIALGASPMNVLGLALGQGFRSALTGIGIGLAMSLALARLIAFFLYGLPAFDPVTFILAPAVLLFVTLSAAFLPAFRAIRINPVEALRSE